MKKTVCILAALAALIWAFGFSAAAAETEEDPFSVYAKVFDSVDGETRDLLKQAGVSETDLSSLLSLSPDSVLSLVAGLFTQSAGAVAALFSSCFIMMVALRLALPFITAESVGELVHTVGALFISFTVVSGAGVAAKACVNALSVMKALMLSLTPVLAAVLTGSGNPAGAVNVQTAVFAFAGGVGVLFADLPVPVSAVGAALSAAAVLNPTGGIERFSALVMKLVSRGMAFVAGIFSAVLALRGAAARAADSVQLKGLRFIVSGSVPVVGSALGDALSALSAGLGTVKNSAAALTVLAVAFAALPALSTALVWKLALWLLGACGELFELKKLPAFMNVFSSVFSVLIAAVTFTACVYVIALSQVIAAGA